MRGWARGSHWHRSARGPRPWRRFSHQNLGSSTAAPSSAGSRGAERHGARSLLPEAASSVRAACAGTCPGSLVRASGSALGGAAQAAGSGLGVDPHRTLTPAGPGAEGGPHRIYRRRRSREGAAAWGRRAGQSRLAGAGRYRVLPFGAGRAPGVGVDSEGWPLRSGQANLAASTPVTVRAWKPGKWAPPPPPWPAAPGESRRRVEVFLPAVRTARCGRRDPGGGKGAVPFRTRALDSRRGM